MSLPESWAFLPKKSITSIAGGAAAPLPPSPHPSSYAYGFSFKWEGLSITQDVYHISKHLKFCPRYSPMRHTLNTLFDCVKILLNSCNRFLMHVHNWFSCQVWLQSRIYPTWVQGVPALTNTKWRVCYWRKLSTCLAQRFIYAHCNTKQGMYF